MRCIEFVYVPRNFQCTLWCYSSPKAFQHSRVFTENSGREQKCSWRGGGTALDKVIDVSVYYNIRSKLGATSVVTSRKRVRFRLRRPGQAAERARGGSTSISGRPSSPASVAENENVPLDIIWDEAQNPASSKRLCVARVFFVGVLSNLSVLELVIPGPPRPRWLRHGNENISDSN